MAYVLNMRNTYVLTLTIMLKSRKDRTKRDKRQNKREKKKKKKGQNASDTVRAKKYRK